MKTEELNDFVFAKMIYEFAQKEWRNRVQKLVEEGNEDAFETTPLSQADLQAAFDLLVWYKDQSLKLFEGSNS